MEIFHNQLFILLLSVIIGMIGFYLRTIDTKVKMMMTESRVRELVEDKLEVVASEQESLKDRLTRLEGTTNRIESKIDSLLIGNKWKP